MFHFDEKDQQSIANFILDNLPRHRQLTLGSVDSSGQPWVVCVNLAYDEDLNLIWKSLEASEHSKNVRADSRVSICIFSQTTNHGDFGFYTKAVAHEVAAEDELRRCLEARSKKGEPLPDLAKFLPPSTVRLYCAEIKEAWIIDDRHLKTQVDLTVLRTEAKKR